MSNDAPRGAFRFAAGWAAENRRAAIIDYRSMAALDLAFLAPVWNAPDNNLIVEGLGEHEEVGLRIRSSPLR